MKLKVELAGCDSRGKIQILEKRRKWVKGNFENFENFSNYYMILDGCMYEFGGYK